MEKILYFDYIEEKLKYSFLSQNIIIISKRNNLIYLTFFQIFSSLFGMFYFIFRRTIIYIYINFITLLLALSGIYGSITINSIFLFIHCILTLSFGCGFFIYTIINDIFTVDSSYGEKERLNDHILLYIFSLPYLYDMFCAYYNYSWLMLLSKLNEKDSYNLLNNNSNDFNENLLNTNSNNNDIKIELNEINNNNNENKICQICYERNKNSFFSPCGHSFCCLICWETLQKNTDKCPICRKKIEKCLKIYY